MSPPTSSADRRVQLRTEVAGTATVVAADHFAGQYLVENLSAGGALLVGDPRLQPGDKVRLLLDLPGRKPLALSAEVVRREVRGGQSFFAVKFKNVAPDIEDTIQEAVLSTLEQLRKVALLEVLVLDDSPEVRRALERDLRALGCHAVSAATPLDAVSQLSSDAPIDTAIVDLRLGHAEGLDFLAYLAELHPALRRVLMSGDVRHDQLQLALTGGRAHAVLDKPWTRERLCQAIARPALRALAPLP